MATGISARLSRAGKKDALHTFNSNSSALVSKLRQEGQLNTVENVMHGIEQVSTLLQAGIEGQYKDNILNMCQHLKVYGACLEVLYKEQLDRAFVVFRNSSQDEEKLDYQSRLHLLELIELRANQWKGTDVMSQYYKKKLSHELETSLSCDTVTSMNLENSAMMSPMSAPLLGPGEIMKSSGKFPKPTRIPGKNYCKDEVVIRNADSGKVMGIKGRRVHMIEELSETIISFQRVNPGAKERLVQITGANEASISHAKQLIEETIRRNASPIRDPNSGMGAAGSSSSLNSSGSEDSHPPILHRGLFHSLSTNDASVGEFKYTVSTNGHTIKITGSNLELVKLCKIILDDFFREKLYNGDKFEEFYTVDTLSRSPLSPHETQTNEPQSPSAFSNGQSQETATPTVEEMFAPCAEEYKPLRRPNIKPEDLMEQKSDKGQPITPEKIKRQYSQECLVRMSLSPQAIAPPDEWDRISIQHPSIIRKVSEPTLAVSS